MVRDKLLAVGVIVDDEELLHITLKGLPKEYNAFRLAIRTRSTHLSFDELSTMLNAKKESLNYGSKIKDTIFAMAATANPKPNNNGFNQSYNRGRGRGNYNNRGGKGGRESNGQSSQFTHFNQFQKVQSNSSGVRLERPICQICGKVGHLALDCYYRMDYAY